MIYDNLKTVVDDLYTGKERRFNRRFLALANHYLFESVAGKPASGGEKGQVENQLGNIGEWLFAPLAQFPTLEALNQWLTQRCTKLAQREHPSQSGHCIAQCFNEEQSLLRPIKSCFDGYIE